MLKIISLILFLLIFSTNAYSAGSDSTPKKVNSDYDKAVESIKFAKKAAEMPRLPFILTKESVNNHANAIAKATSYNDQDIFSLAYANLSGKFFE